MADENTPLTGPIPSMEIPSGPSYVFPRGHRNRQRKIKQLQCCVCSVFMIVFLMAVVITLSYNLSKDINIDEDDISTDIPTTEITPDDVNVTDLLILMTWPIQDEDLPKWNLPNPTEQEKNDALSYGKKALSDRELIEEGIGSPMINSPSYKHQRVVSSSRDARIISKRGFIENIATKSLAQKYGKDNINKDISKRWSIGKGPEIKFNLTKENSSHCNFNSKYRTLNGTCNNRNHPNTYGVAMRPFRRALYPDYSDGISSPRGFFENSSLPSARQISLQVHRPSYETDPHFTVMFAVWGQFLDHDITATAGTQGEGGKPIECCDNSKPKHPECFPVPLGSGDPYYDLYNISCMNFVRSAPAPTGKFGPREQLNQATSFIDGSVVYGNSYEQAKALRLGVSGKLRMFTTPDNRDLLPISTDPTDGCNEFEMNQKGKYCFESGDARANENLHLTSMHLIFARHHNYLSKNLAKINPQWDDETLFQETRRILGAQMQHITYNEFLPILLSNNISEIKGIAINSSNKDTYDEKIDPTVANNFAAAAFRFAHTLLPGLMKATKDANNPAGIALHKMLFNPYSLYGNTGLDDAMFSAVQTPLMKLDPHFTNELSEKLFQNPVESTIKSCGLDLVSLNIQRGRDHGLPSYKEFRKHCDLPPTNTWDELENAVDAQSFNRIKSIYNSVDELDVYTGALSEPPVEGAIVGPLLVCLIGDQFLRLKSGDSFWYERKIGPQRFTKEQLDQIYNTTLAGIICQNSDNVTESQKFVMKVVNKETNPLRNCTELNNFDFSYWLAENSTSQRYSIKIHTESINVITKKV